MEELALQSMIRSREEKATVPSAAVAEETHKVRAALAWWKGGDRLSPVMACVSVSDGERRAVSVRVAVFLWVAFI